MIKEVYLMLSTFIASHKMMLGFFMGSFIGFAFGFMVSDLFHVSKRADEEQERMMQQFKKEEYEEP